VLRIYSLGLRVEGLGLKAYIFGLMVCKDWAQGSRHSVEG
jgi:hypothetical protein